MRGIALVTGLCISITSVLGQVVTNADCYADGEKAVITYSLDKEANIDVQVSLNNGSFQTIERSSLSGDAGVNVRKGKNKKIEWDVLKDRTSLVGDVQFRIIPSESLNAYTKRINRENYQKTGYPALCNRYFSRVGSWSISFLDVGIGAGVRDRKGQAPLYFGIGAFRYRFVEVSLVSFAWELTSTARTYSLASLSSDATRIYWEPQVRFVLPMTDRWAFVFAGGPCLSLRDETDKWSFTANARIRYDISLALMDLFAGYEYNTALIGIAFSLKWSR